MASNASRLDTVYRSLLLSRFFTKGWGKPEHLKRIFELRRQLGKRSVALTFVDRDHPVTITRQEIKSDHKILEGYFISPFAQYLPDLLPEESVKAHFQVVLPTKWPTTNYRPMCIQYAGTGDHYFWRRRRMMALPMLRERGIGSVILENPFYGLRKPQNQIRSSLQQVSDLFVMGGCLILESLVLFHWCERQGFWPLAAHGISMGGHMASLGATVWPKPIALIPCLSWTSASVTFTRGVMSAAIPWDRLEKQYSSMNAYREELVQMIQTETNAFRAGVEFAQNLEASTQQGSASSGQTENGFSVLRKLNEENKSLNLDSTSSSTSSQTAKSEGSSFLESFQVPPFFSSLTPSLSFSTSSKDSPDKNGNDHFTLPFPVRLIGSKNSENSDASQSESLRREAIQFFCGIMDECTHLKNFDIPFDPSLIVIVVAENDAYQPREGVAALPDIWPGAKLRFIPDNGHVASYLFKQDVFRKAIYDAFDDLIQKYGHNHS